MLKYLDISQISFFHIPLWLQNMICMTQILLNLLRHETQRHDAEQRSQTLEVSYSNDFIYMTFWKKTKTIGTKVDQWWPGVK